jgi:soluble lytic murein transglycosylase-like protein
VGALRAVAAALAFVAAVLSFTAQGREVEKWRGLAVAAADRFGLPVEWVMRVIEAESAGRTELGGQPITSHAGAMGLMQIMPATWAGLRAQYGLGPDPHEPRDNIIAGTAYLRAMYDRFGYPGLFGAYNAGPGRYGEYVAKGRPLPRETRDYMARITRAEPLSPVARRRAQGSAPATQQPVIDPIFFARNRADERPLAERRAMGFADPMELPAAMSRPASRSGDLFAVRRDRPGQEP